VRRDVADFRNRDHHTRSMSPRKTFAERRLSAST
jgi:hypothetical protein